MSIPLQSMPALLHPDKIAQKQPHFTWQDTQVTFSRENVRTSCGVLIITSECWVQHVDEKGR